MSDVTPDPLTFVSVRIEAAEKAATATRKALPVARRERAARNRRGRKMKAKGLP